MVVIFTIEGKETWKRTEEKKNRWCGAIALVVGEIITRSNQRMLPALF